MNTANPQPARLAQALSGPEAGPEAGSAWLAALCSAAARLPGDADERRALAQEVRATFAAAKANAERIGMDHLPEAARGKARTALKAAAVAADKSAPEPERETALRRAVALLDELALYYLPTGTDARKAISGRGAPQLPGRRT